MGLVILTLIKIIIYIISRREVKEWEKERNKTAITCVSIFMFWVGIHGRLTLRPTSPLNPGGMDVSIMLHDRA